MIDWPSGWHNIEVRRLSILQLNMKGYLILKSVSKYLYCFFLLGISLWQEKMFLIRYQRKIPAEASLYNKQKILWLSNISPKTKRDIFKSWWPEPFKHPDFWTGTFFFLGEYFFTILDVAVSLLSKNSFLWFKYNQMSLKKILSMSTNKRMASSWDTFGL